MLCLNQFNDAFSLIILYSFQRVDVESKLRRIGNYVLFVYFKISKQYLKKPRLAFWLILYYPIPL
jgi:hypothetical protein